MDVKAETRENLHERGAESGYGVRCLAATYIKTEPVWRLRSTILKKIPAKGWLFYFQIELTPIKGSRVKVVFLPKNY